MNKLINSILALCGVASISNAAPLSNNLSTALDQLDNPNPTVLFLGDSLTLRDGSYYPYLKTKLENDYGSAGYGWQSYSQWTNCGFDSGWTMGIINQDTAPHYSLDGLWASSSSSPWTPQNPVNTGSNINPVLNTKSMEFVLSGTGTLRFENTTNGSFSFHTGSGTQLITFLNQAGRVWVQPMGDSESVVLGALCKNNNSGLLTCRGANGGWGVNNFLQRNSTFEQVLDVIKPNIIFIMLGQNDASSNTQVQYRTKMNQLITRLSNSQPNADFILIASYDSGNPQLSFITEAIYESSLDNNCGFINLYATAPYSFYTSNNYLDDGVHFSHTGGRYVADLLYQTIINNGTNLTEPYVPEPYCSGDVNLDNSVNVSDLSVLLSQFGQNVGSWNGADLNGNSIVNSADLSILLGNFGCSN